MDAVDIICLSVVIAIWLIIVNIIYWINVDDYNYEERQERKKARMRKTKEYKLGFREAREFYLKKPLEIEEVSAEDFWHKVEIDTLKSEKDNLMRTIEEAQEKIMELENELFDLEEEYGISRNNDKN